MMTFKVGDIVQWTRDYTAPPGITNTYGRVTALKDPGSYADISHRYAVDWYTDDDVLVCCFSCVHPCWLELSPLALVKERSHAVSRQRRSAVE